MKFITQVALAEELEAWYRTEVGTPLQQAVSQFVAEMFSRLSRATPNDTGETRKRWRIKRSGRVSSLTDVQSAPADAVIAVELESPQVERFEDGWPTGGVISYSKVQKGEVVGKTRNGYYRVKRTDAKTRRSLQAPDGVVSPVEPKMKEILTAFMKRNGL